MLWFQGPRWCPAALFGMQQAAKRGAERGPGRSPIHPKPPCARGQAGSRGAFTLKPNGGRAAPGGSEAAGAGRERGRGGARGGAGAARIPAPPPPPSPRLPVSPRRRRAGRRGRPSLRGRRLQSWGWVRPGVRAPQNGSGAVTGAPEGVGTAGCGAGVVEVWGCPGVGVLGGVVGVQGQEALGSAVVPVGCDARRGGERWSCPASGGSQGAPMVPTATATRGGSLWDWAPRGQLGGAILGSLKQAMRAAVVSGAASPSCTQTSRTVPGGAGSWGPGELWEWGVSGAELRSPASPGMPVPPPAGCFLGYCLPSGIFPSGKGIMQLHGAGARDLPASMASEASHASSALDLARAGCLTCGTVRASLQALAGGNGPAVW